MSRLPNLLASGRPLIMGVLNGTPDSFSDGGKFLNTDVAVNRALQMVEEGADIIDVGGESTRPGATPVSVQAESDRVLPVLEAVRSCSEVALSCDTSKPEIMQAAAEGGIDLINDIFALQQEGALQVAADCNIPICLMHMQGKPRTMQENPFYKDLVGEIFLFFKDRVSACVTAGISRDRLILDIGFGFGKSPDDNLRLINRLPEFSEFGLPLLVGLSRKSTISRIAEDLLSGSLAGALVAVERGARIIRVHDVSETVAAIRVWRSIQAEKVIDE